MFLNIQPLNVNHNSNTYSNSEQTPKFDAYNGRKSWRNVNSAHSENSNKIHSRGARERRDIFDQIESFISESYAFLSKPLK